MRDEQTRGAGQGAEAGGEVSDRLTPEQLGGAIWLHCPLCERCGQNMANLLNENNRLKTTLAAVSLWLTECAKSYQEGLDAKDRDVNDFSRGMSKGIQLCGDELTEFLKVTAKMGETHRPPKPPEREM